MMQDTLFFSVKTNRKLKLLQATKPILDQVTWARRRLISQKEDKHAYLNHFLCEHQILNLLKDYIRNQITKLIVIIASMS